MPSDPNDPTAPSKPAAKVHAGKIIASIQFKSLPDKGELKGAYADVHRAAAAEAAEALQQQEIPPAMKAQVRDYFDSIRPDRRK
jgi:hypothetical protein